MIFETGYNDIKNVVGDDFIYLEKQINDLFVDENPLNQQLLSFLTAPSKRIRPLLGFLFLRGVFGNLTESQQKVLLAVELIHNATLIHDDVIDEASKRRSQETLNSKFDNNLAVVAGDFLLSIALEQTLNTKSIEVLEHFTAALKAACVGEINQYFNKFNITSIEDYIRKSRDKTALLFQTGILAGLILSAEKDNEELKNAAIEFSENFGIAFQIRDDLINITSSNDLKPSENDFESGIYTAPIIFATQVKPDFLAKNDFSKLKELMVETKAIEKTKDLMDTYFNKSISALKILSDSEYKSAIIELIKLLKSST